MSCSRKTILSGNIKSMGITKYVCNYVVELLCNNKHSGNISKKRGKKVFFLLCNAIINKLILKFAIPDKVKV